MYLLYADESGHVADPKQKYFILAGFAVFERQGFWLAEQLDQIAAKFDPASPETVELHGNPMFQGKGLWRSKDREVRIQALRDALSTLAATQPPLRIFGVVVDSTKIQVDPVYYAFEQLSSRFDQFLRRMHRQGNTQRGLILFDKTVHESTLQNIARDFRTIGHRWGVLRNLSEVPVFLDSKASRLIQLADLIAYAIYRKWSANDSQFYDIFAHRFDNEGGKVHGLHVV
ncbi:DUF3800 domain-containing protein [Verrucomicrobia bacterium LW23]|nr:DUF3800 domain-containing protein [Verrucomicrobia bacterium LW23]